MAITMFDQMLFGLACGHQVVLGRLDGLNSWTCEKCGKPTDLRAEPYRKELEHDRDTADQIINRRGSAANPLSEPIPTIRPDPDGSGPPAQAPARGLEADLRSQLAQMRTPPGG
jgi:hypothetical protein